MTDIREKIKEKVRQESLIYSAKRNCHPAMSSADYENTKIEFSFGAMLWAERVAKLVDALEKVNENCLDYSCGSTSQAALEAFKKELELK